MSKHDNQPASEGASIQRGSDGSESKTRVLVIDRSKWRCGGTKWEPMAGSTMLLNDQGSMCCLGFECLSIGLDEDAILCQGMPSDICRDKDSLLVREGLAAGDWETEYGVRDFIANDTDWTNGAVDINDDADLTQAERESKLTDHFAKRNVKLEFTGEYPAWMVPA